MYTNPTFCSQQSVVSPRKEPKTQGEILKEKISADAERAKQKSSEEKNAGDYIKIGLDTVNKIVDSAPVIHADSPQKLNYLA